tara:strand:+ start:313 stop:642 length:330 start_codon:yes stop_codon:yes gene_type:complete
MSIVFEDGVDINDQKQKGTLIDWSFLDRMKIDQSLLVDRVEFSEKTGWPKRYYYPPDYDYLDPSTKPDEVYYRIEEIRQRFCSQMKRRGYKYVSRAVIKDQSFRIWRVG